MSIQFDNAVRRFNSLILNDLKELGIKSWIAGGSVRDYFRGVSKNVDFDIFFPDIDNYENAKKFFISKGAEVRWESENGIKVFYNKKTYDLIKIFFKDPQDTIDNFDFTVSMFAVDYERVYHGETSFVDLSKKQLMIHKITYPPSTLKRVLKYYKKGFWMCSGELLKVISSIQNMEKINIEPVAVNVEENGTKDENDVTSGILDEFFLGID